MDDKVMSHTPRTDKLADRYGEIDPDSPYWAALNLATELEGVNVELLEALERIATLHERQPFTTIPDLARDIAVAAIKNARNG